MESHLDVEKMYKSQKEIQAEANRLLCKVLENAAKSNVLRTILGIEIARPGILSYEPDEIPTIILSP
jgi:hypothetical protein